jgi:hypothetical protein
MGWCSAADMPVALHHIQRGNLHARARTFFALKRRVPDVIAQHYGDRSVSATVLHASGQKVLTTGLTTYCDSAMIIALRIRHAYVAGQRRTQSNLLNEVSNSRRLCRLLSGFFFALKYGCCTTLLRSMHGVGCTNCSIHNDWTTEALCCRPAARNRAAGP